MSVEDMFTNQRQKSIFSVMGAGLLVVLLFFVNILAQRWFVRIDLTANQDYSLSDTSKELVRNLDDPVIAKVYYSDELPSPYNEVRQYLIDFLNEYKSHSNGNFELEVYDARIDNDEGDEAQQYDVPLQQINVLENDAFTQKAAFLGVVFLYGDKEPEVLPNIQSTTGLEYQISTSLRRLTLEQLPVVGFLQDDEKITSLTGAYQRLNSYISTLYSVESISVDQPIADNIDVLVVAGIKERLSDFTLYQIDQYLMRGGRVIFMDDFIIFDESLDQPFPVAADSGLSELLQTYGVDTGQGMILDTDAYVQYTNVPTNTPGMYIRQPQQVPYLPYIRQFGDSPIAQGMTELVLPFGQALQFTETEGVTSTTLARSSETSWLLTDVYMLGQSNVPDGPTSSYDVALALEGTFTSAYQGQQAPAAPETDEEQVSLPAEPEQVDVSVDTRVAVIGNSYLVEDDFIGGGGGGLFLNILDWMTLNDDLIAVRAKGASVAHIDKDISDGEKTTVKVLMVAAMPILVAVAGIVNWQLGKRRSKRKYISA